MSNYTYIDCKVQGSDLICDRQKLIGGNAVKIRAVFDEGWSDISRYLVFRSVVTGFGDETGESLYSGEPIDISGLIIGDGFLEFGFIGRDGDGNVIKSTSVNTILIENGSYIVNPGVRADSLSIIGRFSAVERSVVIANDTASEAKKTSDEAYTVSSEAVATADNAVNIANEAKVTSGNAVNIANEAKTTAANAESTANAANATSNNAVSIANKADASASEALTMASGAYNTSARAESKADTAKTTAANAVDIAKDAKTASDSALNIANSSLSFAKDANVSAKDVLARADRGEFNGVSASHTWYGSVLEVTSASGTSSMNLKGETGERGYTGAQGKSAYEVAVKNGFEGTEEEWLASLKGEKGDVGEKGGTFTYDDLTAEDKADLLADVYPKNETLSKDEITKAIADAVTRLVGSSPETLDTLAEVAKALGDDPNFATTIMNLIGTKANSSDVYTKDEADAEITDAVKDKQDIGVSYVKEEEDKLLSKKADKNEVSGALKGTASGEVLKIDDISSIEHELGVSVRSKNLFDVSGLKGQTVTNNGGTIICNADGSFTVSGTPTGAVLFKLYLPKVEKDIYTLSLTGDFTNFTVVAYILDANKVLIGGALGSVSATKNSTTIDYTKLADYEYLYFELKRISNDVEMTGTAYVQFEKGETATEYTPFVDVSTVSVVAEDESGEKTTYTVNADGMAEGVTSLYPTTVLYTDAEGVIIEAEYNKDLNKVSFGGGDDKSYVEQIEYNSTDGSLRGRVYVVDHTGTQTSKELRTTGVNDSIPLRNARGNFYVGTPSLALECANKQYVDELIAAIEERLTAGGL